MYHVLWKPTRSKLCSLYRDLGVMLFLVIRSLIPFLSPGTEGLRLLPKVTQPVKDGTGI